MEDCRFCMGGVPHTQSHDPPPEEERLEVLKSWGPATADRVMGGTDKLCPEDGGFLRWGPRQASSLCVPLCSLVC